ncbi:hypothetical protein THL1_1794 [Pseudomonas sp. TCU-HL1]|nr:hypothetical protein THL1_1794 [Pseudomonas sp. TCU-HL1]
MPVPDIFSELSAGAWMGSRFFFLPVLQGQLAGGLKPTLEKVS